MATDKDLAKPAATAGTAGTEGSGETGRVIAEFEYALIIAHLAFERWALNCLAAAGETGLTLTDSLVLHAVHHRARSTRLTDIAFVLNVDDDHVISYSLRKLEKAGILKSLKQGKEKFYSTTEKGADLIARYRQNQRAYLLSALEHFPGSLGEVETLSETMRAMSGFYDQAARRAATLL